MELKSRSSKVQGVIVKFKVLIATFLLFLLSSQASAQPQKFGLVFSGNAFFGTFTKPSPYDSNTQVPSTFPTNFGIGFQYTAQPTDAPINARIGFELMLPLFQDSSGPDSIALLFLAMKITLDLVYEFDLTPSDGVLVGAGAGFDSVFGFVPLGYTELHALIGYSRSIAENLRLTLEAQPGYGFQSGAGYPIINFRAGLRFQVP
jgi:hypothetical protein